MGCLYKIHGPLLYIGITCYTAERRFAQHIYDSCNGYNSHLANAIRKYGAQAFTVKTLVISNDYDYLNDLEVKAIIAYNTLSPNGYNMITGGNQRRWSEDLKIKMKGKIISKEHRAKLSVAIKNRLDFDDIMNRLHDSARGSRSDQVRANISAGKRKADEQRRIDGIKIILPPRSEEYRLKKSLQAKKQWQEGRFGRRQKRNSEK